jgi:glutamine cyclotransferase
MFQFNRIASIFLYSVLVMHLSGCTGNPSDNQQTISGTDNTARPAPPFINYSVVQAYPHDTAAFTQGLEIYQGNLIESTGIAGRSSLRKVDYKKGRNLKNIPIADPFFAEGVTVLRDTAYQLTWTNHVVFVYDMKKFSLIRNMSWSGDGWGITNDGTHLIISDGSDKLYFVEPQNLKLVKVVSVTDNYGPVNNLNELEYINGFVYANRWQYDYIVKIDPGNGMVTGRIDLTDFLAKNSKSDLSYLKKPGSIAEQMGAVLNGIAWDSAKGTMLLTGKLWPEIFEIRLNQ